MPAVFGGYVGAIVEDGLHARALLELADELRRAMPGTLGDHPLAYLWCYKYEDVSIGSPDQGYYKQTKKSFIVWSLFLATAISFLWAYFLCVCRTYSNSLKSEEQLEKERLEQLEKDKNGPFGFKVPEIPKVPGVVD